MSDTNFFGLFGVAVLVNVGVTLKSTGLWETVGVKLGLLPAPAVATAADEAAKADTAELDKKHLELLKQTGIIDWQQQGTRSIYTLNKSKLAELSNHLAHLAGNRLASASQKI